MIAAVLEVVAPSDPLLLDEALESGKSPIIWVQHELNQAGDHTAQVRALLL